MRGLGTHFSRSNADFWTSVDVDTTVSLARQSRTDGIDNTNTESTSLQAIAKGEDSVGGLAALTDKDNNVIPEDGRLSIQEVTSKLNANRYLSQLLKYGASGQARMVARPTCDEDHPPGTADDREVGTESTEGDLVLIEVDTSTHRVDDGLRLLVYFLLHECVKFALHDGRHFKFKRLDVSDSSGLARSLLALAFAPQTVNMKFAIGDVCNIIVFEIKDALCVLNDSCSVRSYEELNGLRKTIF
jgi:hypothetical protein